MKILTVSLIAAAMLGVWGSSQAWACACGCGIFEVGTGALYPTAAGGKISLEWDYMDQNQNWSGTAQAPAADNNDKEIVTNFFKLNGQFMFKHSWGVEVEVPYWYRSFSTLDPDGVTIDTFNHSALGDIRVMGMYTGFSTDMSTGLLFGLKLPTGDNTYPNFDPDTEIGTGSTDLLLGIYHYGSIFGSTDWNWTAELRVDMPFLYQNNYLPGGEFDGSVGINFRGISLGDLAIVPLVQVSASYRLADNVVNPNNPAQGGDPNNSGYERIIFVPGLDFEFDAFRLFATVGLPIFQNVTGNQLVAPVLLKVMLSFSF